MILFLYLYVQSMKLITRDTDYALRAIGFLAKRTNRLITVPELVSVLGIPRPFLRKILQILHRHNILKSSKGYRGGFSLAKPLNRIYLSDLIKIFQGSTKLNECIFKKRICPNRGSCLLRKRILKIEAYVSKQLSSIPLSSLI